MEKPQTVEEWKALLAKYVNKNIPGVKTELQYDPKYLEHKISTIQTPDEARKIFVELGWNAKPGDELWWYDEHPTPLAGFAGPALVRDGQILYVERRMIY